jgi:predicted nucleic acid-binding Zn ribbon protein
MLLTTKQDDAQRARCVVTLGDGIRHCLRGLGLEEKNREQRAVLAFGSVVSEVVGEVAAANATATEIRKGKLLVSVRKDALRHRLLFERDRIQNCLNEAAGGNVVRSIRFGR